MAKKKMAAVENVDVKKPRAKSMKRRTKVARDALLFEPVDGTGAEPPAAAGKRTLSEHDIGDTAGLVWSVLADSSGATLAKLKKSIKAPAELVLAAIGWLAREGKLEFESNGRKQSFRLR